MSEAVLLIPVYNESLRLKAFLSTIPDDVHVIVVDDGSSDATWSILVAGLADRQKRAQDAQSAAKQYRFICLEPTVAMLSQTAHAPQCFSELNKQFNNQLIIQDNYQEKKEEKYQEKYQEKQQDNKDNKDKKDNRITQQGIIDTLVLRLPANRGKSVALWEGLQALVWGRSAGLFAQADYIVLADGDGQHDVRLAPALASALQRRGLDLLVANRGLERYPFLKVLGNRALTLQAWLLSGFPWQDTLCGFRVFHRSKLQIVQKLFQGGGFCCEQEMCVAFPLLGWRVANDFPIVVPHTRSNSTWLDAWRIFCSGFKTWWYCMKSKLFNKKN